MVIFNWIPDIVNFTELNAGYMYFYIFYSYILKLCSGIKLSFLETVWSLWVLLLKCQAEPEQHLVEGYSAPLLKQYTLLSINPVPQVLTRFLHPGYLEHELFPALCELQEFFFLLLPGGSFPASGSFLTDWHWSVFSWGLEWNPLHISGALCVALRILAAMAPPKSLLSPQLWETAGFVWAHPPGGAT